jgi:hypothetical protein
MADHKNGMLDDIPDEPEAAPAAEAPEIEAQAPEPQSDQPEGQEGDKPKRQDTRPEGYVTKGERDRIASELQQERQQRALYEDRFNKVVEKFPLGWIGWRQRQDQRADEARAEQQKNFERQEQERQEFNDTLNRARTRFQKVVADRPEVADLYEAVQNKVGDYYASQGVPKHQIPELITRYEAEVIKWARQEYLPIEEALEQAAAKFGIAPPQRQAAAKPTPERDPQTGQFLPSEAEKAAKVRESQERNASLSSAPGSPVKKMTGKELASMSEDDMWRQFESVGRRPGAKQFDREMGFR